MCMFLSSHPLWNDNAQNKGGYADFRRFAPKTGYHSNMPLFPCLGICEQAPVALQIGLTYHYHYYYLYAVQSCLVSSLLRREPEQSQLPRVYVCRLVGWLRGTVVRTLVFDQRTFLSHALDLQLMGDHVCGYAVRYRSTN